MQAVELLWIAIIGGGLAWLMLSSREASDAGPEAQQDPTPVPAEKPKRWAERPQPEERPRREVRPPRDPRRPRPPRARLSRREEESRWREIIDRFEP